MAPLAIIFYFCWKQTQTRPTAWELLAGPSGCPLSSDWTGDMKGLALDHFPVQSLTAGPGSQATPPPHKGRGQGLSPAWRSQRSVGWHGEHTDPRHVHTQTTVTRLIKPQEICLWLFSVSVKCLDLVVSHRAKGLLTYADERHWLEGKHSSQNPGQGKTARPQHGPMDRPEAEWAEGPPLGCMWSSACGRLTQRGPRPSEKGNNSQGSLSTVTKEAVKGLIGNDNGATDRAAASPPFESLWSRPPTLRTGPSGRRRTLRCGHPLQKTGVLWACPAHSAQPVKSYVQREDQINSCTFHSHEPSKTLILLFLISLWPSLSGCWGKASLWPAIYRAGWDKEKESHVWSQQAALSGASVFWSVKWEWALPHRRGDRSSLQTVVYNMSVKRKPDPYPRTTVSLDMFHQMAGHLANTGGTKQQPGCSLHLKIKFQEFLRDSSKYWKTGALGGTKEKINLSKSCGDQMSFTHSFIHLLLDRLHTEYWAYRDK